MSHIELFVCLSCMSLVDADQLPMAGVGVEKWPAHVCFLKNDIIAPRPLQEEPHLQAGGTRPDHAVVPFLRRRFFGEIRWDEEDT